MDGLDYVRGKNDKRTSVTKYERSLGKGRCLRRAPLHRHKTKLVVLAVDQIDHGCVICSGYTEVPSFGSG